MPASTPSYYEKPSASYYLQFQKAAEKSDKLSAYTKEADPLMDKFFVTGESSGKSGESMRAKLAAWDTRFSDASKSG